ncbi:hypothetical protein F5141DRAFT_83253 [Pisolithus sp. B1]|nr:hypothetical protein F5141DRAFT_83253 [Pisolithus sp. B1]
MYISMLATCLLANLLTTSICKPGSLLPATHLRVPGFPLLGGWKSRYNLVPARIAEEVGRQNRVEKATLGEMHPAACGQRPGILGRPISHRPHICIPQMKIRTLSL